MLVFLGFALGTNKLGESFTNSNNTLGTLVSLGFASGTNDTLGIITTLYEDLPITGANQPFGAHELIKTFLLPQTRVI